MKLLAAVNAVPPSPTASPARKTSVVPFGPFRSSWTHGRLLAETTLFRVNLTFVTFPVSPATAIIDGYGLPWEESGAEIAVALVHVTALATTDPQAPQATLEKT